MLIHSCRVLVACALWGGLGEVDASTRAQSAQETGTGPSVQVQKTVTGQLALTVRKTPLVDVFAQLTRQTGVDFRYTRLPPEPVSVLCAERSLRDLMFCILGSEADLVFKRADQSGKFFDGWAEIKVLESTFAHAPKLESVTATPKQADAQQETLDLLLAKTKDANPDERAEALAKLSFSKEEEEVGRARESLQAGLTDGSGEVRAEAVSGLARLNGSLQSFDLLSSAMQDQDPEVRLAAVDALAATDQESLQLLQKALADQDESVRVLAEAKLNPQ